MTVTSGRSAGTVAPSSRPNSRGMTVGPPPGPTLSYKGQGLATGTLGILSNAARSLNGRSTTVNSVLAHFRLT